MEGIRAWRSLSGRGEVTDAVVLVAQLVAYFVHGKSHVPERPLGGVVDLVDDADRFGSATKSRSNVPSLMRLSASPE